MRKILALLACIATAPATAGSYLNPEGPAVPLERWTEFCGRHPEECAVEPGGPHAIDWHANHAFFAAWVNTYVNQTVKQVTDIEHWGIPDRYDLAEDGRGDCEDLQLVKRRKLAGMFLPRSAMRLALVITPGGEGHAVLMLRTTQGDSILDNILKEVRAWDDTPYIYIKRESDDGKGWVSLGGRSGARVAR